MIQEGKYVVADARKALGLIKDDSVDLVVTDPPYGIGYKQTQGRKARKTILKGDSPAEAPYLIREVVGELARVMKPESTIYMFAPGGRTMFRQGSSLVAELERFFEIRNVIIWDKTAIGPGTYWRVQYESIVMGSLGRVGNWQGGRARSNVLRYKRIRTIKEGHPTPKPPDLIEELMACSSNEGDLVLDPFAGSGVVGAVAQKLGRRFICLDIDERWAKEAKERYGLEVEIF